MRATKEVVRELTNKNLDPCESHAVKAEKDVTMDAGPAGGPDQ